MELHAVSFGNKEKYRRLARVLELSAADNSPTTPLTIHQIDSPDTEIYQAARPHCKTHWLNNARKAKHHYQIIHQAPDGELLGMLDTDTMILRDVSQIADIDFDLAYTVRPGQWPINTGVYFLRACRRVRSFLDLWYGFVVRMLSDAQLHDYWREERSFGAIHQAALGAALSECDWITTIELPCAEWNCMYTHYDGSARIVHVLGSLRDWCFGPRRAKNVSEKELVRRWQAYDG